MRPNCTGLSNTIALLIVSLVGGRMADFSPRKLKRTKQPRTVSRRQQYLCVPTIDAICFEQSLAPCGSKTTVLFFSGMPQSMLWLP